MLRRFERLVVTVATMALASCASISKSVVDNYTKLTGRVTAEVESGLNPTYRYLRVTLSGRSTFVLLGDIDPHPDGPIEIYYSSTGEVLRFQHGRLVGATGLRTEWRNVSLKGVPSWTAINSQKSAEFRRIRDVMPGYHYGMEDHIASNKVSPPAKSALAEIPPETLTWFEERISPQSKVSEILPPSRYGLSFEGNQEIVVFGEQCLSSTLCLAWQQWTPRKK